MKSDIVILKDTVSDLNQRVGYLETDMSEVKTDISYMKDEIKGIREEQKWMRVQWENDFQKGLNIVSENHLNLDRKLNEILKRQESIDIYKLRVNVLSRDMHDVKARLHML